MVNKSQKYEIFFIHLRALTDEEIYKVHVLKILLNFTLI